ncbi:MAG: hypothetical protein AAF771_00975 [Pseudomonadota bacterium]
MEHPTTLIYLPDGETMGQLHRGWPDGLRVALCLEEGGRSDLVFVQEEDVANAPAQVADLLGRDDSDFVIVPTLGGYPTRRLSFGEEQQLCGMLADMADLPGQARAFVKDRAGREEQAATGSWAMPEPEELTHAPAPPPPQAAARAAPRMRIIRPEPAAEPPAPAAQPLATAHWGHIERAGTVLKIAIEGPVGERAPNDDIFAHPVALSGDRRRLQAVISLPPYDRKNLPGCFQIPLESLPEGCPDIPAGSSHRVFIRAEGQVLTITLPALAPAGASKPKPRAQKPKVTPKPKRRGMLGPAVAAAVALAMVQVGTSQEAKDIIRLAGSYPTNTQDK